MKTKRCWHCRQILPIALFGRQTTSDGRRPACKLCRAQRRSELREGAEPRRPWSMEGVYQ